MATCRVDPLMTVNISRTLAVVHEVLRSVVLQTPRSSHSELELDTLMNIQSMELAVEQMCQAAVEHILFPVTLEVNGKLLSAKIFLSYVQFSSVLFVTHTAQYTQRNARKETVYVIWEVRPKKLNVPLYDDDDDDAQICKARPNNNNTLTSKAP